MGAPPRPDDFAMGGYFKFTLDNDPLKEESHFHEVTGLNVHIDLTEIQEGGKNDGCHKRPGSTRYENICMKRGSTTSKAFFNWIGLKTVGGTDGSRTSVTGGRTGAGGPSSN